MLHYYNYTTHTAEGWWGRRDFLHRWWRLYAGDARWTPPAYPVLRQALDAGQNSYIAARFPRLIHLEALPRRVSQGGQISGTGFGGALMEEPVAAAIILSDQRRHDGTAYLSLLHCVNDEETLERLLAAVQENLWEMGCQRVIGPLGLSPHLPSGALQNFFHIAPPLQTPYNPPYLPELLESALEPLTTSRLYTITTTGARPPGLPSGIQFVPFAPSRLSEDLLPLLAAACEANGDFPAPDTAEAAFLVRWLAAWPLSGWLAQIGEQPVGFILLQPDLTTQVRRANGGRTWLWRRWLRWRSRQSVRAGRLLLGGVLPTWRGQGLGHHLWQQALFLAQGQGWQTLTVGPLVTETVGQMVLEKWGAQPQQRYIIYTSEP